MKTYYYQESQACSSLFPIGSRIREDKWSTGQQFISNPAKSLAHVRELIRANTDGTNLSTVHLNEIDTLYTLYLGGNFEFSPELDDPREFSYRVPFIRGQINTTWYPVNVCEPNNLETLDKTLPNRWSVAKTLTLGQQVLASTAVKDVVGATLQPMSVPGYVFISLTGSTQRGINFKDTLYPSTVIIKGLTTKGTIEEEVVEFPCDITLRSKKRYSKIISVRPIHIVPDTALISVKTADGHPQYHVDLDHFIALDRNEQYPFWNLFSDSVLECSYLIPGDEKSFTLTPLYRWNLIDDTGAIPTNSDFCIMPHCPYIVLASGTKIHFYHKFLEYPTQERLNLLVGKTDGCLLTIDSSDFFPLPQDTIELSAAIGSSARKAQHFRWEIATPSSSVFVPYGDDGNFNLVSGVGINDSWIGVNYIDNEYKPQFFNLLIDEPGDYLVALIASNQDGTISRDIRLVRGMEKEPVLTFNFSTLIDNIDNVFVDGDENIWVADGSEATCLKFHKDMALVDYIKKVVVLHERYDEVEVIP
jgi:hypothetical protein